MIWMISFLCAPKSWFADILLAVDELEVRKGALTEILVDHLI